MTLFQRILNFGKSEAPVQPNISFGRYTDVYKTKEQYDAWDKAIELFEKESYMDSYREFLRYLRDENQDNVTWREEDNTLHFEFRQGSRRIVGAASATHVKAKSLIAKADTTNVSFMRRLMEHNFSLKYSRFALSPEHVVTILFDTEVADGSPLKLYHALKELAVSADKQDDLLLDEFKMLQPIDTLPGGDIPDAEKEAKYNYLLREIQKAFEVFEAAKPDPNQYPGGYAYMFLNLSYKLDYLVRPEGFMMETLEKVHRAYFASSEEKNTQLKNFALRKELQKLLERSKESFFKEMYRTRSTFGITTPVNHDKVAALIEGELPNMDWYKDNGHHYLALGIPGYIAGYALFNYAMPKPDRDYFHFYFQVMEAGFFRDLGFQQQIHDAEGKPNQKTIVRQIRDIAAKNRDTFPKINPDTSKLDFASPVTFAKTYMEMVKALDLTKE